MAETTTPTQAEKVLLAAHDLDRTQPTFGVEQLTVAAWQQDAETFGLRGLIQYPDHNKVVACLSGDRGLVCKGWLQRTAPREYRLTLEGRRVLARLLNGLNGNGTPAPPAVKLDRDQQAALRHLLGSAAFRKLEEGRKGELTTADAWLFWGIGQGDRGEAVDARLAATADFLRTLEETLAQADGLMGDGRAVTAGDVRVLARLSEYMRERFAVHLKLLRGRVAKGVSR
jgi:hypothetical protein